MTPTTDPAAIVLVDTDGLKLRFGDLKANPLVVVMVRFFGSPSCQAFVSDLSGAVASRRFPGSAKVVAIGGSSSDQARSLRYDHGVNVPVFVDPEQAVRQVAGLGDLGRGLFNPRGAQHHAAAKRCGMTPQRPTPPRDARRSPGIALFGPDMEVRWVHEGAFVGDYPSIDHLVRQVAAEVVTPRTAEHVKILTARR
jgi:hypothetical protein